MSTAKLLDGAYPGERDLIWFSYDRMIEVEDSVVTATVMVSDPSGADATPSVRLSGGPTITPRRVGQWLDGPVAGANYLLHCSGTMQSGRRLSIYAVLPTRAG